MNAERTQLCRSALPRGGPLNLRLVVMCADWVREIGSYGRPRTSSPTGP